MHCKPPPPDGSQGSNRRGRYSRVNNRWAVNEIEMVDGDMMPEFHDDDSDIIQRVWTGLCGVDIEECGRGLGWVQQREMARARACGCVWMYLPQGA